VKCSRTGLCSQEDPSHRPWGFQEVLGAAVPQVWSIRPPRVPAGLCQQDSIPCALAALLVVGDDHKSVESSNGLGCKGPLKAIQSSPLPKQGHPEQAAQDHVQVGLEYLQRRRLHSLPGQPGTGLRHPQREEVLPHLQLELPLLQFVPIAPCPVTGHYWKESGPVLLTPTLQIFVGISKVPNVSLFSLVALFYPSEQVATPG